MALATKRPAFDPARLLVARTAFKFSGISFFPGDAFPGDKLAGVEIDQRRVESMWNARLLEAGEQKPAPVRTVATVEPKAPASKPAKASKPVAAAADWSVKSRGFGKFDVVSAAGAVVASGLSKAEAQAKADEMNSETRRGAGEPAADLVGSAPTGDAAGSSE